MAADIYFYLRNPKAKNLTSICLNFNYDGLRLQCSTGYKIAPSKWNSKKKYPKNQIEDYDYYKKFLENVTRIIWDYYKKETSEGRVPSPFQCQRNLFLTLENEAKKGKVVEEKKLSFFEVLHKYIEIKSQSQSERTLKKFRTLDKTLLQFQKKKRYRISFESIDLNFSDKFKNYLLSVPNPRVESGKGMLNDSIAKYFTNLKTFLEWAHHRGYHNNIEYKKFRTKIRSKQDIISLTESELETLYQLDLSNNPRLERVRDLFCFGCFTGQRWSDIENYDPKCIKGNSWDFISVKTKKRTIIPFKGYCSRAFNILEKYNFELPKISPQKFNDYLKEVGNLAEINEEVTIVRYSGNKEVKFSKPKYEFMSSHMARRTAVTILLQKGVPPTTLMKLTGHADLRTLMKYENTSQSALEQALDDL